MPLTKLFFLFSLNPKIAKQQLDYYRKRGVQRLPIDMIFNWIMYVHWRKILLLSSGYITLFWILQNRQIPLVSQNLFLIHIFISRAEHTSLPFITYSEISLQRTASKISVSWYCCTGNFLTSKCSCIYWNIAIEFNKTLLCLYFWFYNKISLR